MGRLKYFLFSLICLFSWCIVFAENEVVVKSITPIYDETSTMVVIEEENLHSVVFNDKEQSVEYKIVLENTTDKDLPVDNVELSTPTEDFLVYELEGIDSDSVIESNSTKEIVISLETVSKDGWGRNFKDELVANVSFDTTVLNTTADIFNPDTGDLILFVSLVIVGIVVSFIFLKKYKFARYGVFVVAFFSLVPCIKADFRFVVPIEVQASYESQNIMEASKNNQGKYVDYWQYVAKIKNFYIVNKFDELSDYDYKFDVSEAKNEKVIAYLVENEDDSDYYDLHLQADGLIYANADASSYFADMTNLDFINNIEGLDTSFTTKMSNMFYKTGYSSDIFTLDLGDNFNTSNVTAMDWMFYQTGYSNTDFTLDLGNNFDTSNVTNMKAIFNTTGYSSKIMTLDLGEKFDTSKVVEMSHMFYKTGYSSKNFTLDLKDKFDTSKVIKMWAMFVGTGYSSEMFTLNLGDNFNTSNVTDMLWMFQETGYSSKVMTLDLGEKFDTSKVKDMGDMFYKTGMSSPVFTLNLGDKFDTSNVTNMAQMFRQTGQKSKIFTLDLGDKFNTSSVKNMTYMFAALGMYNPNFTLDLGDNFDTSNVTVMKSMFDSVGYYSTSFVLDLGDKFDTSKVINMNSMFREAGYTSEEFTINLGDKFNTSNVTDMYYMFYNAGYSSLVFDLDIGESFDTSNVTDMDHMFSGAGPLSTKLNFEITIRNPNISKYGYIFRYTATISESKIVVNYTKDTEAIVDAMIATKSTNSNVVKGVQVD